MNSFKIECNENVDNYYNDVVVNSCHNEIELSCDPTISLVSIYTYKD